MNNERRSEGLAGATRDEGSNPPPLTPAAGEALARRFHALYECLAPTFGYETRKETRSFDPTTPNGRLMIAVCSVLEQADRIADLERENAALQECVFSIVRNTSGTLRINIFALPDEIDKET